MMLGLGLQMASTGKRGTASGGGFLAGATLDMRFNRARYLGATPASLTVVRAGSLATDLTYTQTTRTSYNGFSSDTLRIDQSGNNRGLLVEESRTQYLGVTDAPATQTTSSLGTGTYTCWCIGGTSVAVAGTTATITGAGSAVPGTPLVFVVTVAGTVTATVTGAVRYFQIENGAFATSYIPNASAAGSTNTRAADSVVLGGASFTTVYGSPSALTLYAQGAIYAAPASSAAVAALASIDDTTSNNRLQLRRTDGSGTPTGSYAVVSGGVVQASLSLPTSATRLKMAARAGLNDFQGAINGSLTVADTAGVLLVSPTQLQFGNGPSLSAANGFIERVAFVRSAYTDAALQAVTL
jgi:hypothetical protein